MVTNNIYRGKYIDGGKLKKINKSKLGVVFSNKSLCTRCGTCIGACEENALIVGRDFFPEINENACTSCGICEKVCPGGKVKFKELAELTFGHTKNNDSFDGSVLKTFVGFSNDKKIRGNGAGGGIITGILFDLLRRNIVDGCIVTRMNPEKPYYGEVFIARTYEELLESQQSKYIIIPVNAILKEIRDLKGRFAIAALPCQIHGLRLMEKQKNPVMNKIKLIVGLFCASAMEPFVALEMLNINKIDPKDINRFNFREGDWPGNIIATLKNGKKIKMHYSNFKDGAINYMTQLYSPFRCQTCIDGSSEFSDISVSDAWTRDETGKYIFKSQSKILVRTKKGLDVVNDVMNNGSITIEDVTKNKNYRTHKLHRKKKGLKAPLRIDRLEKKGIKVPKYDRKITNYSFKENIEERLETFIMMIGHYRLFRYPLYKILTSKFGIPLIKIRQYNKSKKYRSK